MYQRRRSSPRHTSDHAYLHACLLGSIHLINKPTRLSINEWLPQRYPNSGCSSLGSAGAPSAGPMLWRCCWRQQRCCIRMLGERARLPKNGSAWLKDARHSPFLTRATRSLAIAIMCLRVRRVAPARSSNIAMFDVSSMRISGCA